MFRELLRNDSNFDFFSKRWFAYVFSLILVGGSIALWIQKGNGKYGVDYKGGHELVVKIEGVIDSEKIRVALRSSGIENAVVQSFEAASGEYSIRLGGSDDESVDNAKLVRESVDAALKKGFEGKYSILKTDYVGPTVGAELRRKGLIALSLGLVGILLYVSLRFEFAFALGVVVALFHDVIVAAGIYLLGGFEITVGTLAAALTIVGYSANDTIVIFDRVREEIFKRKDFNLEKLMNECINATLSRTIITSLLTLFSALALYVLGGGAIADLSLFLLAGIVAGSYSTIFIASPIVLAWENFRTRKH